MYKNPNAKFSSPRTNMMNKPTYTFAIPTAPEGAVLWSATVTYTFFVPPSPPPMAEVPALVLAPENETDSENDSWAENVFASPVTFDTMEQNMRFNELACDILNMSDTDVDTWIRDLTREGVEENPGPMTEGDAVQEDQTKSSDALPFPIPFAPAPPSPPPSSIRPEAATVFTQRIKQRYEHDGLITSPFVLNLIKNVEKHPERLDKLREEYNSYLKNKEKEIPYEEEETKLIMMQGLPLTHELRCELLACIGDEPTFNERLAPVMLRALPSPPTGSLHVEQKFRCGKCQKIGHNAGECNYRSPRPSSAPPSRGSKMDRLVADSIRDDEAQIAGRLDALREKQRQDREESGDMRPGSMDGFRRSYYDQQDREKDEKEKGKEKKNNLHVPGGGADDHEDDFHRSLVRKIERTSFMWKRSGVPAASAPAWAVSCLAGFVSLCTNLTFKASLVTAVRRISLLDEPRELKAFMLDQFLSPPSFMRSHVIAPIKPNLPSLTDFLQGNWNKVLLAASATLGLGLFLDVVISKHTNAVPLIRANPIVNWFLGAPVDTYKVKFDSWRRNPYERDEDARPDTQATGDVKHFNPLLANFQLIRKGFFTPVRQVYGVYAETLMQVNTFGNTHLGMDDETALSKCLNTTSRLNTVGIDRWESLSQEDFQHNAVVTAGWSRLAHKDSIGAFNQNFSDPGGFVPSLLGQDGTKYQSQQSLIKRWAPRSENAKWYLGVGLLSLSVWGLTYGIMRCFTPTKVIETLWSRELLSGLQPVCQTSTNPFSRSLPLTSGSSLSLNSLLSHLIMTYRMLIGWTTPTIRWLGAMSYRIFGTNAATQPSLKDIFKW